MTLLRRADLAATCDSHVLPRQQTEEQLVLGTTEMPKIQSLLLN